MPNTKHYRAEIVAIGDELTSGVRLDTNSQWISQRLGDLGITVAFHSTVGDELDDMVAVLQTATRRSDIVLLTGGLGPTADDLTRQAIAEMAGVELEKNDSVLQHIERMYESRGREMPPNNEIQAWFPVGSRIIGNPEGTAPGIDFEKKAEQENNSQTCRMFALPGVPVEMKQMWKATVEPELKALIGVDFVIHHHTIHCFGSGESHIETLLPDIVQRGRDPQVGITASAATISLRVSTRGDSKDQCLDRMQPTITTIRECLGELVYGENGQTLQEVVAAILDSKDLNVAIADAGTHGTVGKVLSESDSSRKILTSSEIITESVNNLEKLAAVTAISKGAFFGLAIGHINRDERIVRDGESFYDVAIADANGQHKKSIRFSGHSGWREIRAVKEVLNHFRLHLLGLT